MKTSLFPNGTLVQIVLEWCDSPDEAKEIFVIVGEDEGKGRVDIAPKEWDYERQGAIRPVQTVGVEMIRNATTSPN